MLEPRKGASEIALSEADHMSHLRAIEVSTLSFKNKVLSPFSMWVK